MYKARITQQTPTAFIFMIDQSGSMEEKTTIANQHMTKAEAVAGVTNRILTELTLLSTKDDGVRDYFDIAVVGYNSHRIESMLTNSQTFIKPSQLVAMDTPMVRQFSERILPSGDIVPTTQLYPGWVKPACIGNTPMYAAMRYAYEMARDWCRRPENRNSFPLTIFNVTDGDSNDCSQEQLIEIASQIKSLQTIDGNVLLLNIHISATECGKQVMFPSDISQLPMSKEAWTLFEMSSIMPEIYNKQIATINQYNNTSAGHFRGMCFNSYIGDLLSLLNIGSVSSVYSIQ